MKKKNTRRRKSKYPNLDPGLNLRIRWEEINDIASYANDLSDADKEWLNKFIGEWANADLNYKNLSKNLHNTPELKKSCTDKNNARHRDIFSRAKASGNLIGIEDILQEQNEGLVTEELQDDSDKEELEKSFDSSDDSDNN